MSFKPGDRIKFAGMRRRMTVRAVSDRYLICTIPFPPRKTVVYTIVDFELGVRGTEDLLFGRGFGTDEQCRQGLARIERGDSGVSRRNCIPLDIE